MLKQLLTLALAAGALAPAMAQTSVSIGINQPGFYGRVNIGDVPPPALILPQPVIIQQQRVVRERPPVYLYVPTLHQQNWRSYCGRYSACGQPVYFVRDEWVRERYQSEHPGWDRGRHRGWDKHDKHDKHGRSDERGPGGKGRGHDKGKHD
ncbi:MAG: hypothetical protein ABI699_17745 [Caldimonas sp.]